MEIFYPQIGRTVVNREHIGTLGWGLVAGGVLAWDMIATETLSNAFHRGLENEKTRPFVVAGLGITACHLMGVIPPKLDPFKLIPTREI